MPVMRYYPNAPISIEGLFFALEWRNWAASVGDHYKTGGYFELRHEKKPGWRARGYLQKHGRLETVPKAGPSTRRT